MRYLLLFIVLLMFMLVSSCSGGLKGEYSDDSGLFTYKFISSTKVEVTTNIFGASQTAEFDYSLEKNKIKMGPKGSGSRQVIEIDKDGCLIPPGAGGMLDIRLCKK